MQLTHKPVSSLNFKGVFISAIDYLPVAWLLPQHRQ